MIDVGSQTETQWRYVLVDGRYAGEPVREFGDWTTHEDATSWGRAEQYDAVHAGAPYDAVYLEKREVTYGEPVRVELDEGSGDAGDE